MRCMTPNITQTTNALVAGFPHLDPDEQRLARTVYAQLATGQPAHPAAIADAAGWAVADLRQRLDAWPAVFRNRDGAVVGFWGLNVEPVTGHQLDLDRRRVWAWCAYDTLFIPHLLGVTAQVTSPCRTTGEQVRLTVTHDGVSGLEPAGAVLSLLTPDAPIDDNVRETLCHYIHFFATPAAADSWTATNPGTFALTVTDGFEIARRMNAAVFGVVTAGT